MDDATHDLDKLAAALVSFQAAIPEIKKNKTAKVRMKNGGEYTYQYADLADIWNSIRKPLSEAKLAVVQTLDGGADGTTKLTTIVLHESGQKLTSCLDIPTAEKTPQEAGSLFTYYKRYALSAVLGISTEEDDDGQAGNKKPAAKPAASTKKAASEKQRGLIASLARKAGYDDEWLQGVMDKVKTSADASAIIETLNSKVEGAPSEAVRDEQIEEIKQLSKEAGAGDDWMANAIMTTDTAQEADKVIANLKKQLKQEPTERVWRQ